MPAWDDFLSFDGDKHSFEYSNMPYCCGAVVLGAFGGGESYDDPYSEMPYKQFKRYLINSLNGIKRMGVNLVYATTMDNQPTAARVLTDIGFYTAGEHKENGNKVGFQGERRIQAWFLPMVEYKRR